MSRYYEPYALAECVPEEGEIMPNRMWLCKQSPDDLGYFWYHKAPEIDWFTINRDVSA